MGNICDVRKFVAALISNKSLTTFADRYTMQNIMKLRSRTSGMRGAQLPSMASCGCMYLLVQFQNPEDKDLSLAADTVSLAYHHLCRLHSADPWSVHHGGCDGKSQWP